MTKDELISKYTKIWNESKEKHADARRLKHQAKDVEDKITYQADQDYYATKNRLVGKFLEDLNSLS